MVLWTSRQNRQRVQICHRKTHCIAKPNAKEDYWVSQSAYLSSGPAKGMPIREQGETRGLLRMKTRRKRPFWR